MGRSQYFELFSLRGKCVRVGVDEFEDVEWIEVRPCTRFTVPWETRGLRELLHVRILMGRKEINGTATIKDPRASFVAQSSFLWLRRT